MNRIISKFNSNGFALIGVILIFVIIGALLSIGTRLIKPSAQKHLRVETIDAVQAAKDAVIGYAAANYKLPSNTEFTSIARNPKDAYGKDLIYLYFANLTSDVCGRKSTGLTGSSVSETGTDLAFLVLSGFDDYNVDTTDTGGAITASKSYSSADTVTIPNTDRAEWVSLKELQILVGCAESATGSRVIILNNSLPYGIKKSAYSATIYADGGIQFASGGDYKWCWTSTISQSKLDDLELALTCSGTLDKSSACSLATGTWQQCTSLSMASDELKKNNIYDYTFYVKDDDGNMDQKYLTLTVYKEKYKVWNDAGNKYDFKDDSGNCKKVDDTKEITKEVNKLDLSKGDVLLERYSTNDDSCGGGVQASLTYNEARLADTDLDGKVWFSGADK